MKKTLLVLMMATVTLSAFAVFSQDDVIVFRAGAWYCDYSVLGGFGDGTLDTSLIGFGTGADTPLVGDVNGDGIADLVTVTAAGNYNWAAAHSVNDGFGKGLMSTSTTSAVSGFGTVAGSDGKSGSSRRSRLLEKRPSEEVGH